MLIAPVPASEFPVPADVAKAWCDTQHDRDAAFSTILAPFTKIPVKRELTEIFLDDFAKAARVGLEETLNMCASFFAEQAKRLRVPTLIVAGNYDPLLTPDVLKATIMTQIAGARMVALPADTRFRRRCPNRQQHCWRRSFQDWGHVNDQWLARAEHLVEVPRPK